MRGIAVSIFISFFATSKEYCVKGPGTYQLIIILHCKKLCMAVGLIMT
jgi:hypothetical protein